MARHQRFGASSEKNSQQGELFNEAELAACETPDEPVEPAPEAGPAEAVSDPKPRGRKPLPKHLPRIPVHLDLSEEEKRGAIDTFYVTVREELDIIPAQVGFI